MKKLDELIAVLKRWQVNISVYWGHIYLYGGDIRAREHYGSMLAARKHMAADFILKLAETDKDLAYAIEERAAIREADELPGDIRSAVLCNFNESWVHF